MADFLSALCGTRNGDSGPLSVRGIAASECSPPLPASGAPGLLQFGLFFFFFRNRRDSQSTRCHTSLGAGSTALRRALEAGKPLCLAPCLLPSLGFSAPSGFSWVARSGQEIFLDKRVVRESSCFHVLEPRSDKWRKIWIDLPAVHTLFQNQMDFSRSCLINVSN